LTRRVGFMMLALALLAVTAAWQTPALLQKIPGRQIARLPVVVQQWLVPPPASDMLPTPVGQVDVSQLLLAAPASATPSATVMAEPVPPTAVPTNATVALSTAVPTIPPATLTPTPPPTATPIPWPATARLKNIQHHFQDWNNCGPATISMALSYFGIYHPQAQTARLLKGNPEDRNVSPDEMAAYVNAQTDLQAIFRANGHLDDLRRLISSGFPVIIELGINPPGEYRWMGWYGHYLLVVAYDDDQELFWVYDSWFGTSETPGENANRDGRQVSYAELDRQWREFNRNYILLFRPEDGRAINHLLASQLDDQQMWTDAVTRAQTELQAEPEDAFLWFNLGTSLTALGDYERAAVAFDQARAIGLPWRMLWYQFGPYEAYYQVGRYQQLLLLAETTLQNRPYFEESFYYQGLALAALGRNAEAERSYRQAATLNANYIPAIAAP
jgi:tetratricopeptide (TPR) repeat protein